MSDLYVYQGAQYPADKLPKGVKAKDCLTLDEYLKKNRRGGDNPSRARKPEVDPTRKPTVDATVKPGGDKPIGEMTKPELVAYAEAHSITIDAEANKPDIYEAVKAAAGDTD